MHVEDSAKYWGLNGLGRIGREVLAQNSVLNRKAEGGGINISTINEPLKPVEQIVAELRHDLIHGAFPGDISISPFGDDVISSENDLIYVNGLRIRITREKDPEKAWRGRELFGIIEASGAFRERAKAARHLNETGVKYVLITAPSADSDLSLVSGINGTAFTGQQIVDNASCTTKSALAVIQTLDREFDIEDADLETVHAATGPELRMLMERMRLRYADPEAIVAAIRSGILDSKEVDWILDENTGAADNVVRILPELAGRFRARAKRVASPNGSLSIMNFLFERATNPDDIREVLRAAAGRYPGGVLRTVKSLPSTAALNEMNDDAVVPLDRITGPAKPKSRGIFTVVAGYSNEVGPARNAVETARLMEDYKAA